MLELVGRFHDALREEESGSHAYRQLHAICLSRLYWDKFDFETVCLRIFSSFPEPADRRMLWSYLSPPSRQRRPFPTRPSRR